MFLEVCHTMCMSSTQCGTGEDDVSAWCKLHGAEFKGNRSHLVHWFTSNRVEPEPTNKLTSLIPRASLVSLQAMK